MKRFSASLALLMSTIFFSFAAIPDTTRIIDADKVIVRTSTKETNDPWSTPSATSIVTPYKARVRGLENIKDLSVMVPNFFIPDYGSRMTTPVYLRGVGARSSGQSIGMYVDNIPYMDKSTFDFDFLDIQRIEVLRGPQGTLYGRNAMGGIINVYTLSPFDYQGTRIAVGAGLYNTLNAKVSTYQKLGANTAISFSAYGDKTDGYFRNIHTGAKADAGWNAGGRIKFEWRITPKLTATLATAYDYTDQNAFPYGKYDEKTGDIGDVMYNDRGTYLRNMSNNSLRLEYRTDKILVTSNTGYQWLNDNMWMDQDFTKASIFTINQRQLQNSINQEIVVKSNDKTKNYQWSVGFFGFYNSMQTGSQVMFKKDGISTILQPVFDNMMPPTIPIKLTIQDDEIGNPGEFFTPSYGMAVFHQSTFNNLITKGLSATIGIRLDYEHQYINYNTSMSMAIHASNKRPGPGMLPPNGITMNLNQTLQGGDQQQFLRALPKISIKYECSPNIFTYATVSKGYKAGGYNIQMFSEVIQDSLRNNRPPMSGGRTGSNTQQPAAQAQASTDTAPKYNLNDVISYKPESVWNYEVGTRGTFFDGLFSTELAVFYMDVTNLQLTQFVNGGNGRILTNAGKGSSIGVEVSLSANPVKNLYLDVNYGYTHSTFRDYNYGTDKTGTPVDYSGNFVPYVPQHTFSIGASYNLDIRQSWIKGMTFAVNYNGAGKIYWNDANTVQQPFYGLLNFKYIVRSDWARLEVWANNITNTQYGAFYFESFGNSFMQKGRPFTAGITLGFDF